MFKNLVLVVVGGGLGSLCRYLVSLFAFGLVKDYPLGTLLVNVLGCFLAGVLLPLLWSRDEAWRLFLIVGVLGGLTTFSSYGLETFTLAKQRPLVAIAHLLMNNTFGLAAVWLGETVAIKIRG